MADNFSLNCDVRELTLGASFTNNKASQYHTIKYDFKPASVDVNKMATVEVSTNNQVTVTVPHLDGAGIPQTVFRGSQRPYTKECVLIIDRVTGEMTLEKLSSNIQVKKTRQESSLKPRPLTPVTAEFTNTTQRSSSRTRVATNRRTNPNAGAGNTAQPNNQARFNGNQMQKPQNMVRSPPRVKTSPPQAPWSAGGNSTLASLPMIGLDDNPAPVHNGYARAPERPERPERNERPERPERIERPERVERPAYERAPIPPADIRHQDIVPSSVQQDDSSSSSSSNSDSDSDSGSDSDDNSGAYHHTNGNVSNPALPSDVLNDDLCLSESGSDSD